MGSYHGSHAEKQLEIFNGRWGAIELQSLNFAFQHLFNIRYFSKNPKFLAILYAEGIFNQTRELIFAISGMAADAKIRESNNPPEPSEQLFLVGFFGGDALYRLMSIKDKMLAGFYCCFFNLNPESKLESSKCRDKLKKVVKRKRLNKHMREALRKFIIFDGKDHWRRVELFRNMKTHRLEPKIQFKQIDPKRDLIYPVKITRSKALELAESDAISGYGAAYKELPEQYKEKEVQRYLKLRKFGHAYYEQKVPTSRLISYPDFENLVEECLRDIVECSVLFFQALPQISAFYNLK